MTRESLETAVRRAEAVVRWPPACEDVSPGAEVRPLLDVLPSSIVKTLTGNTNLCGTVVCKV
jgi:hypothetical protein